jgi:hypothetical protein
MARRQASVESPGGFVSRMTEGPQSEASGLRRHQAPSSW